MSKKYWCIGNNIKMFRFTKISCIDILDYDSTTIQYWKICIYIYIYMCVDTQLYVILLWFDVLYQSINFQVTYGS